MLKERDEEVSRHARGAARPVEYVLPRGVGIIAPWAVAEPQMGQVVSRWWKRPINRGN